MKVADRMPEIYAETASRYEGVVGRARVLHFLALVRLMAFRGDDHVVDLGCGPGNLSREIAPFVRRITGLDASPSMVAQARRQLPAAEFHVGDALHTPFPDAAFTAAVSSQLLPWLPDAVGFFREAARVLAPGARFGLITSATSTYREFFQAFEKILRTYEEYYQTDSVNQVWGSRTYTVKQLTGLLASAGFRSEEWVIVQTEVPATADEYLDVIQMFTGDHYLYPIPEEYRERAKAELAAFLHRDGLTLNERSIVLVARRV